MLNKVKRLRIESLIRVIGWGLIVFWAQWRFVVDSATTPYLIIDEERIYSELTSFEYPSIQLYTVLDAVQSSLCLVPCEFGRISVFENFYDKNFM